MKCNTGLKWINHFHVNVLFLYPLKTSENQRFPDVFRGYRNGTLARKGLIVDVTKPEVDFIIFNKAFLSLKSLYFKTVTLAGKNPDI